jgi:hypothetical protein
MLTAKLVLRIYTTLGMESCPGCLMLNDVYGSAGSNTLSLLFVSHSHLLQHAAEYTCHQAALPCLACHLDTSLAAGV